MRKTSLFVFVISVANVHAMQKKRKKDSLACQSLRHGSRIQLYVQSYSCTAVLPHIQQWAQYVHVIPRLSEQQQDPHSAVGPVLLRSLCTMYGTPVAGRRHDGGHQPWCTARSQVRGIRYLRLLT